MKNQELASNLFSRLECLDTVPTEPMPAGWSRRNWVQRDAMAFAEIACDVNETKEDQS
jgi:hypothetical protein